MQLYPKKITKKAWNLRNEGLRLLNDNKFLEARDCFDKAVKLIPTFEWAWYNKAKACLYAGLFEEAIESCEKSLELRPGDQHTERIKELAERYKAVQEESYGRPREIIMGT